MNEPDYQESYFIPCPSHNWNPTDTVLDPSIDAAVPDSHVNTAFYPPETDGAYHDSYTSTRQMSAIASNPESRFQSGNHGFPISNDFSNNINASHHQSDPCDLTQDGAQSFFPSMASFDNKVDDAIIVSSQHDDSLNQMGVEPQPAVASTTTASRSSLSRSGNVRKFEEHGTKVPRAKCQSCQKTFARSSDMRRHALKHRTGEPRFQCGVRACGYGGSHRRDKIIQHVRNCHSKGREHKETFCVGDFDLPGSGDCLFSQSFLESNDFENGIVSGLAGRWSSHYGGHLVYLLSEDGKGLQRTTPTLENQIENCRHLSYEQKEAKIQEFRAKLPASLQERFKDVKPYWRS